jgi:hypothetical protein
MPGCASSKKVAHSVSEIVFTFFGFHGDFYLSNANWQTACHHVAVAGFCTASFEGGCKAGGEPRRLLN